MKSYKRIWCGVLFMAALGMGVEALAVNSKVVRQGTGAVLEKGEVKDVVVSSKGRIQLGRAAEVLADSGDDIWSINAMATSGGTLYVGTSPDGAIYKYGAGKLVKIYPVDNDANSDDAGGDPNDNGEGEKVDDEEYLANEHIFAMGEAISGRLLAGISGPKCKLLRYGKGEMETVFEPEDAKYIFAIVTDESGNIYLGTGPKGNIYKLDSLANEGRALYKAGDKNILSLTVDGGTLYAGSDGRGLVYRIDTESGNASVLYDSDQDEITALMVGADKEVYAAGTSAKMVAAQVKFAKQAAGAGRPESKEQDDKQMGEEGGLRLKVAHTESDEKKNGAQRSAPSSSSRKPGEASSVYKITAEGFVTDVFTEAAVYPGVAARRVHVIPHQALRYIFPVSPLGNVSVALDDMFGIAGNEVVSAPGKTVPHRLSILCSGLPGIVRVIHAGAIRETRKIVKRLTNGDRSLAGRARHFDLGSLT